MEKIVGIIVAGGKSIRFGDDKLLVEIKDKSLIYYSLRAFDRIKRISELILVVREDKMNFYQEKIKEWNLSKKIKLVVGGKERQHSVYNGIRSIEEPCEYVIIHDAARPFVKIENIEKLIDFCIERKTSGILGIPSKDTIKLVDENGKVEATLERRKVWLIQTPQMFPYNLLLEAHNKAIQDGFLGTDDAVLLERLGYPVYVVEGDPFNIKITTKEDLVWIDHISKILELE